MLEMITDESGNIEQNRRVAKNMSLCAIINEILGNLSGPTIFWEYNEEIRKLKVFSNDGGFTKEDKIAIIKKYKSGRDRGKGTAGVNGIGIRQVFDLISTSEKIILRTISQNEKVKMYFYYYKDKPSWMVEDDWEHPVKGDNISHPWGKLDDTDIKEYNHICSYCNLDCEERGSYWEIPINDKYHDEFINNNETIYNNCAKFFNSKIFKGDLSFYFQRKVIKINEPMCSPDKELIIKWYKITDKKKKKIYFLC